MAKKKKPAASRKKNFSSSPFSNLKGLSVSGDEEKASPPVTPTPQQDSEEPASFADEMALLGVERLSSDVEDENAAPLENKPPQSECPEKAISPGEEDLFLSAIGDLDVRFNDNLPVEELPQSTSARRLKQLKQGKLAPEASLDLHGLLRAEVAAKLRFFLQDALYQGWRTVLVITGKGLHSETGEPVLRLEAEQFLAKEGRRWVAEWRRAPRKYGGSGALVLFLRKHER